eukprot:NODE_36_length_36011_cov_1.012920.p28 type:complete len:107 gc:universal NODE_36_length_36011_cov_1.012920:5390-5710(+)
MVCLCLRLVWKQLCKCNLKTEMYTISYLVGIYLKQHMNWLYVRHYCTPKVKWLILWLWMMFGLEDQSLWEVLFNSNQRSFTVSYQKTSLPFLIPGKIHLLSKLLQM